MAMNPMKMMQIKSAWDKFCRNHPKFPLFVDAAKRTKLEEGTVIEMTIITADEHKISTNVKLTKEDVELIRELKSAM